jgi:hypothetical protein
MLRVFPVIISWFPIYRGTSILEFHICLYAASTATFSGEFGAYDFTGSFTAFGTLKNPFSILFYIRLEYW